MGAVPHFGQVAKKLSLRPLKIARKPIVCVAPYEYRGNMKFGMRKPSPKRSYKAATSGRAKRAAKRAVNPLYGKKGMGLLKDPSRAIKNAIYRRTTFGWRDLFK